MSRGSALVAIVFAFVCGVMVGNLTAGGSVKGMARGAVEEQPAGAAPAPEAEIERFRIPVTAAQPARGPADALVTMVVFSDFQCPFSGRAEGTIDQLLQQYRGKLRVVWRNNPLAFHKQALPAAEAAMEAKAQGGDGKFWAMHKKLFENQRALEQENLEKYAAEVGLNLDRFKQALDQHTHKRSIDADAALARRMGAMGTPAFFINGRFLSGAQPVVKFKEIIDEELKQTEALLKRGVPRNRLYSALIQKGLTQKPEEKQPEQKEPRKVRRPDPNAVYKVPVGKSASKGPADALVTIVEFSDFQCPFSNRANPTVEQILNTYGRDVRAVFKQNPLPFHSDAMPAAEAALAAGNQGKFWEMHDKLFANQRALKRENLEKYAAELKLNLAKFKAALDGKVGQAEIQEDQKLARSLGASGTPSFFINGRSLRGAQPFEAFKAVIDEELGKAKALVAKGTPRAKVYETIIANGATSPQFIEIENEKAEPARPEERPDADKVYQIAAPVNGKAPQKGARNGKVLMYEYSEFQCPFCHRVNPTLEQVLKEYGDKVTIIWRHYPLPFHNNAKLAAEAAQEVFAQAGSDKFWKYHDLLFANQRALERENLEKFAQQVGGINLARFKKALDDHVNAKVVEADMEAVSKAGARIGTPSFFINGKLLQGAQPYERFKQAIDEALAGK
jgi:protein-disulfide isomerase